MTRFFIILLIQLWALEVTHAAPVFEQAYMANLPFFEKDTNLGDVVLEIQGETIQWIERESLLIILQGIVNEEMLLSIKKLPKKIPLQELPFSISFSPEELRVIANFPLTDKKRNSTNLGNDLKDEEREAIRPSPFGGVINYRLEKNWAHQDQGGDYFDAQFNSFINLKGLVFENQTYYRDNQENPWFRGDTRLVKDFEKREIRAQLGDVYPQIQGFMAPRPLGGINVARNFTLNPYRMPFPTGQHNFSLKSRSFVKYFVNSVLVKSEYLPAGNYAAKDIPLNNGLNTILIEATDDLGQKQVFVFRSSASISLLNEGESRFDLSYGVPFLDSATIRKYEDDEGKVFSGYFQYGLNSLLSSSLYLQNQSNFNLLGTEFIYATVLGNFTFGGANSKMPTENGYASSLGYQLVTQGKKWYDSHTLGLRYENRSKEFKSTALDLSSAVHNNYALTYTIPTTSFMTLSLGGNYGDVRDNTLSDRYGYDSSMSFRVPGGHNVTFFLSRNRDEFKRWNDVAYVFFTFIFPESNNFISGLYDYNKESVKTTILKDNQNRLYKTRTQGIIDYGSDEQTGEVDLNYPTPVGDFGGRLAATRTTSTDSSQAKGSARLNSALVFAFQDNHFAGGISRPVSGSFVLFSPEKNLDDQKIALKSTSPYTEAESGLFNEIVFSNLIAYQYREIQLDPTYLDPGRTLNKEKFIIYPTYRSAHLIRLEERGAVTLQGRLIDRGGNPIPLQVGTLNNIPFFTNREGQIFIEGVEPGLYQLSLSDREETVSIKIDKTKRGLVNLGTIILKEVE